MFRRDDGGCCWSLRLHACQGRAMTLPLFPRAALPAHKPLPEPSCFRLWSRCPREVLLRVTSTRHDAFLSPSRELRSVGGGGPVGDGRIGVSTFTDTSNEVPGTETPKKDVDTFPRWQALSRTFSLLELLKQAQRSQITCPGHTDSRSWSPTSPHQFLQLPN